MKDYIWQFLLVLCFICTVFSISWNLNNKTNENIAKETLKAIITTGQDPIKLGCGIMIASGKSSKSVEKLEFCFDYFTKHSLVD